MSLNNYFKVAFLSHVPESFSFRSPSVALLSGVGGEVFATPREEGWAYPMAYLRCSI